MYAHSVAMLERDTKDLQELIQDLEGRSGPYELIREHLDAALAYLVGAMPREFAFNLKLVKELLPDLDDGPLRARISAFVRDHEPRTA
jgi:hypothetical protein